MIHLEEIGELLEAADLQGPVAEELPRYLERIQDDPVLREDIEERSFSLLYSNILSPPSDWINSEDFLGDEGYLHNLLSVLNTLPIAFETHNRLNVPSGITRETFADIGRWTEYFQKEKGKYGLSTRITWWFTRHIQARLFSLGRLQFFIRPFPGTVLVLVNRAGETCLVAREGMACGPDGLLSENNPVFRTKYETGGEGFRGHPVLDGFVQAEKKFYPRFQWRLAVGKAFPLLDIHIPSGSSLSFESCADSIRRAYDFFPDHFYDYPFRGFMCESWFLDPRYKEVLSPESNILKFAAKLNLYPHGQNSNEGFWRVFGEGAESLAQAPRKTRMQKAVAAYLESGGKLTAGGGIVLNTEKPWGVSPPQDLLL